MRAPSTILRDLANSRNLTNWFHYKQAHALSAFSAKHVGYNLLLATCHLFLWSIIIENICTFAVWSIERRRNWHYDNNNKNSARILSFPFVHWVGVLGSKSLRKWHEYSLMPGVRAIYGRRWIRVALIGKSHARLIQRPISDISEVDQYSVFKGRRKNRDQRSTNPLLDRGGRSWACPCTRPRRHRPICNYIF